MAITTLLVASIFAVLFIGALFNPLLGILGYLCVYLMYNQYLWWTFTITEIFVRPSFVAVAFIIVGCILHSDKLNWKITRREFELYLFVGFMFFISLVFGLGTYRGTWWALEKMTKTMVFIFLLIRVVHEYNQFRVVIWCLIGCALFMAFQAREVGVFVDGRLENIGGIDFNEANASSLFMVFSSILLGFELLRASWKFKPLYTFGIALMLNTIILTRSRAGVLSIVVAALYILFSVTSRFRKQLYIYIALGAVLFIYLSDYYFIDRITNFEDEPLIVQNETGEIAGNVSRMELWKASIQMFKDHPLGIGVRNFQRLIHRYDPRIWGKDAHNTYVIVYTELGIFGIVLFLKITGGALLQLRRIRVRIKENYLGGDLDLYAMALFASLLAYLLGGMTTHTYLYQEIVWILLALPICLENLVLKASVNPEIAEHTSGDVEMSISSTSISERL